MPRVFIKTLAMTNRSVIPRRACFDGQPRNLKSILNKKSRKRFCRAKDFLGRGEADGVFCILCTHKMLTLSRASTSFHDGLTLDGQPRNLKSFLRQPQMLTEPKIIVKNGCEKFVFLAPVFFYSPKAKLSGYSLFTTFYPRRRWELIL